MRENKKEAPCRWSRPDRRQTEEAGGLIPHLHCIMAAGGIQAAKKLSRFDREQIFRDAKKEFIALQMTGQALCSYEAFARMIVEALGV